MNDKMRKDPKEMVHLGLMVTREQRAEFRSKVEFEGETMSMALRGLMDQYINRGLPIHPDGKFVTRISWNEMVAAGPERHGMTEAHIID